MRKEVVITGMGSICSQAMSPQQLFNRLENRQSSVRNHPELTGLFNPACAYIDNEIFTQLATDQTARLGYALGGANCLAMYAAEQAIESSNIDLNKTYRKGLFIASNRYTLTAQQLLDLAKHYDGSVNRFYLDNYILHERHASSTYFHKRQDMASQVLGDLYGFDMVCTLGDACAAGSMAIGNGYRRISHGDLDVALVGGADAVSNYIPMLIFNLLGALSQKTSDTPETISRPFDKDRSGFVMGEGGAFLVLESLEHAQRRGAPIMAKLSGYAALMEGWRITDSPPDGSQYARCISAALSDAGLSAQDIDHINAHGTSTQKNDSNESAAIKRVFAELAATIPVTANKSALGHTLGASGAFEAVLSVMSLQKQTFLPTLNFNEGDVGTKELNIVTEARPGEIKHIVSNSFGFGGENSVLVLSRQ